MNDDDLDKEVEQRERKNKREAYAVIIICVTCILLFGSLIVGEHVSPFGAVVALGARLFALHLIEVI